MKCPNCEGASSVLETRDELGGFVLKRRRKCAQCGHKWNTYELHQRIFTSKRSFVVEWLGVCLRRREKRLQHMEIAKELHKGWRVMGEKYNLGESGVHYAARMGRKHLKDIQQNASYTRSQEQGRQTRV